jgi:hypothetical protein
MLVYPPPDRINTGADGTKRPKPWRVGAADPAMTSTSPPTSAPAGDKFSSRQLETVNEAVALAEELVSNHYKMSTSQWLKRRYDVRSRIDLSGSEIVDGPLAQVIRYEGRQAETPLNSRAFDFYKICLQDHAIKAALDKSPELQLYPLVVYVVAHELIHIVRFSTFRQNFHATEEERWTEEGRVHAETRKILNSTGIPGMDAVLRFFSHWQQAMDSLQDF